MLVFLFLYVFKNLLCNQNFSIPTGNFLLKYLCIYVCMHVCALVPYKPLKWLRYFITHHIVVYVGIRLKGFHYSKNAEINFMKIFFFFFFHHNFVDVQVYYMLQINGEF